MLATLCLARMTLCTPIPVAEANQEFDRILASASVGNLTQNPSIKNVDPYKPTKTVLDRYLGNPGKIW